VSPRKRKPLVPDLPVPKRPFRDSALFNGALASIVVVVAWVTGGELARAIVIAVIFFAAATGWSWWKFRAKMEEQRREEAARQAKAARR
jgi:hypothetical protein